MSRRVIAVLAIFASLTAYAAEPKPARSKVVVCTRCMQATVEFLASDAMQGRGSATEFERIAAEYAASELRKAGIAPAWPDGSYFQKVPLTFMSFTEPPKLTAGTDVKWTAGKEFLVRRMSGPEVAGKLQRLAVDAVEKAEPGSVVVVEGVQASSREGQQKLRPWMRSKAAAVIVEIGDEMWQKLAGRPAELPVQFGEDGAAEPAATFPILVTAQSMQELAKLAEGTEIRLSGQVAKTTKTSWNVSGILKPKKAAKSAKAVMFSAHIDHVGVKEQPGGGDSIFNGADDDATGVSAVLELARILGSQAEGPGRPVLFSLFGSEELGLLGSRYMAEHPPVPLKELAALVEFEQLGHPEPKAKLDQLWMTGWDRTDLGTTLASKGATLIADPYPELNFFAASDNYSFAAKGVVAHTISASGHFPQYHTPQDEVKNLNWERMRLGFGGVVDSLVWLANSDFEPKWNKK